MASNVEFKGSFYSEMIIGYPNVRPLLRSVKFTKSFCHLLILEEKISQNSVSYTIEASIQVAAFAPAYHHFVDCKRSGRESESLPGAL